MKNNTQGPTTTTSSVATPPPVRRSVLIGSLVTLVAGSSLAFALPSFATAPVASATLGTTAVVRAVTTVPSTVPTTVAARVHAVARPASTTTRVTPTTTASPTTTLRPRPRVAHVASVTTATTATTTVPTPAPTPKPAVVAAPSVQLRLRTNIAPSPNFLAAGTGTFVNGVATYENPCITPQSMWPVFTSAQPCTDYILSAINNARAVEGVPAMVLPSNWSSLSTAQQLFVVANLERTARGLPAYVGLNAALSAEAQRAAVAGSDPGIASGFAIGLDAQGVPGMGGAWGAGFNVLATDYVWMYLDGWAGNAAATSNVACTSAANAGCWAHREELLGTAPGFNPGVGLSATNAVMGTGFAIVNGHASLVDLIELPKGAVPALTFTWASEVPYLG